jgi:hypothetical protein
MVSALAAPQTGHVNVDSSTGSEYLFSIFQASYDQIENPLQYGGWGWGGSKVWKRLLAAVVCPQTQIFAI